MLEVRLANIESAKKSNRQNAKRQVRNRDVRSRARTQVKNARQAIETDAKGAAPVVKKAARELDRGGDQGRAAQEEHRPP